LGAKLRLAPTLQQLTAKLIAFAEASNQQNFVDSNANMSDCNLGLN
jgi:hypothetical protein